MKKHILFVCRYNRFRSVMAEAFFNEYNKNKSFVAKSASPIRGQAISDNVKNLAREFKVKIKKSPQGLTSNLMRWQDITVVVANDVPPELFRKNKSLGKKVIYWPIPDVKSNNRGQMKRIAGEIRKNVIKLVRSLQ